MRTNIETGLTLLEYCTYIGIDPFTMAQFASGFPNAAPVCDKPVFSYQWQQDYLSRTEFAIAIAEAERRIAEHLGYWTYPHYAVNEVTPYPTPANVRQWGGGANTRGLWKSVRLKYGLVQSPGIRTRTEIDNAVAITRIDTDGDTIKETFTATVANVPDGTTADQIALYILPADRVGNFIGDGERWRIKPIYVEIVGATATIRGHACLLVKPTLYEGYDNEGLDVSLDTNYLTTVAGYVVKTDTTSTDSVLNQGSAFWETTTCCGETGVTLLPLTVSPRNADRGFVGVDWATQNCVGYREPDRVSINYLSGVPLVNGWVDEAYGRIVAMLATALLPSDACGCERSQRIIADLKKPIFESDQEQAPSFAPDDAGSNPFGVQTGAVYAWRDIVQLRHIQGVEL